MVRAKVQMFDRSKTQIDEQKESTSTVVESEYISRLEKLYDGK